ncbi:MAG: hypothetical protein ACJAXH_001709, partial [Colwellia sp.]
NNFIYRVVKVIPKLARYSRFSENHEAAWV